MSLLNSGWPHRAKRLASPKLNPPVNSDSDPDPMPKEDPEETSAQDPEVLSWGHPGLDTTPAPNWPGLRSLLQQLPPQDSDERYCLALGEEELAELRLFCAQRRREALGQGVACLVPLKLEECTCENCREPLRPGEYGVFAARAGERRCWHRACFACQACGQALINLIYFYHDGRLYCGRHHAELLRPRCPACDQLIFSRRCTEAEGQRWHENHFCCQDCAGPLGGGRYALPGGGPCCPSCFERRYSDAGSSPAPTLESRASPAASPPPLHRTPRPELRGPQLSPRVPGRRAPRASRTHPAPPLGLRRGTRSWAGAAAALCWAEAGRGGSLEATHGGGAHGSGRGGRLGPDWDWLLAAAPPESGRRRLAALRWAFLTPPGTGEEGLCRVGDRDCAQPNAATISRATLLATAASSSLETRSGMLGSSAEQEYRAGDQTEARHGQAQGRLETALDPKEDAPCPTCSSSSESEPEDFFLGQRLPRPWETPAPLRTGDSDTSRRHCTIC